ncbi:MAG: thiolase family protein [Alphaproteobacteria bacterium]|nr:thiolase family protein [Alphaproteobacteria bacterium]
MQRNTSSYIIAARRTALGRIGGLHRNRRIEALAAPVIEAALSDCGIAPDRVEELILGNASQGGNPARLVALASGLSETATAYTIDRQCASGLDAVLNACRNVSDGEAEVVLAGGAESLSTAPWRIAKPKSLYHQPHFIGLEPSLTDATEEPHLFEASELLSQRLNIAREHQDAWALKSHLKAESGREKRKFVGEIVPLRSNAEEAKDQSAANGASPEDFSSEPPWLPPEGRLTAANTSIMHDGAAIAVVVSQYVWEELGRPPAIRLVASVSRGVAPDNEAGAPMEAMRKLYDRLEGFNPKDIGLVELSETSAAQAIAFSTSLGLEDDLINPEGGAVVRGHPLAAAGAVLVVRLFSRMVRQRGTGKVQYGVATLGAIGGIGVAALFESV